MEKLDCIKKGNEYLEALYNSFVELQEIKALKERLLKSDVTPNELADGLVQMCGYMFRIGTLVSQLTNEANQAYVYRKLSFVFEYNVISNEVKIKDKEATATIKTKEEYEDELTKRYVADYMKTLYDNYKTFTSAMQSKLALLRNELKQLS